MGVYSGGQVIFWYLYNKHIGICETPMPPGWHGESAQKPLLQACLQRWFIVQIAHVTKVTWQFRNYLIINT